MILSIENNVFENKIHDVSPCPSIHFELFIFFIKSIALLVLLIEEIM